MLCIPQREGEGFVITFRCDKCGQRFKVPEIQAGKKGRCPKCKSTLAVPAWPEAPAQSAGMVHFTCSMCRQEIEEPETSRGKLVECPHCNCYVAVPSEKISADETGASIQPGKEDDVFDKGPEELQRLEGEIAVQQQPEVVEKRKLPWPIDILLYPASASGLKNIGAIVTGQTLAQFLSVFCVGWILRIIIALYMFWYFCECIRDSACGGLRAPATFDIRPSLGQMLWGYLGLLASYLLLFGPVTFYRAHTELSEIETNAVIFWSLQTYGIFFFPMAILAVVMFESVMGLNPALIIRSITATFLPYCGLVVLFQGLGVMFVIGVMRLVPAGGASGSILSVLLTSILVLAGFLWLLLVAGHLLGRFYWRYQEKLNWKV